MVIIAASIISKENKVLFSRQFLGTSKSLLLSNLKGFLSLVKSNSQHTFVENDSIRYVYQSMEKFYLVLLTSITSNVFEALDALRLLGQIVMHFCNPDEEESVAKNCFQLVYAFDEVVSAGYREPVNLDDIKRSFEMHSDSELLALMRKQEKEKQARAVMKLKEKEIRMQEKLKMSGMKAFYDANDFSTRMTSFGKLPSSSISSAGPSFQGVRNAPSIRTSSSEYTAPSENVKSLSLQKLPTNKFQYSESKLNVTTENIHDLEISFKETISASFDRNGALKLYQISGAMVVKVNKEFLKRAVFSFGALKSSKFPLQVHPNLDEGLFNEKGILAIKNGGKNFPIGNDISLLRWRGEITSSDELPLRVNTWVETSGPTEANVLIQCDMHPNFEFYNLRICIPLCPSARKIEVESISAGRFSQTASQFIWEMDYMERNSPQLTMELNVNDFKGSTDSFYPMTCLFTSHTCHNQFGVVSVRESEQAEPLNSSNFCTSSTLEPQSYEIL